MGEEPVKGGIKKSIKNWRLVDLDTGEVWMWVSGGYAVDHDHVLTEVQRNDGEAVP